MKRERLARVTPGFSFKKEKFDPDVIFAGYPSFAVPMNIDTTDIEQFARCSLEHLLLILKHSDKHAPQTSSVYGRYVYVCIIFESREQLYGFAREVDIFRYGKVDIASEVFAEAIGIDLATGKRMDANKEKRSSFGSMATKIGAGFNFGNSTLQLNHIQKNTETSEKIKNIRADEKKLAEYMDWVADGGYYLCICFKDEDEKTRILTALGLEAEYGGKFIWCHDLARALNIELAPCEHKNKRVYSGRDHRIEELVGEEI